MDLQRVVQEMRPVIYQAGRIAMDHFRNVKAERKADRSFVTAADRAVEQFVREELHHRFPEHGVYGEESGHHRMQDAEYVWAIDPIDGTAPFVYELPVWCISVGLIHRQKPLAGFVYLTVTAEFFWAVDGGPAYLNHRIIQVAEPREMGRGSCIVAPSITFRGFEVRYEGRALSFGSAAAHICCVARGKIQGGFLKQVRVYDIAASAMVLKAAGGVMRYLSGREVDLWELINGDQTPEPFVIGHPQNAEQLRQLFFLREFVPEPPE